MNRVPLEDVGESSVGHSNVLKGANFINVRAENMKNLFLVEKH